MSLKLTSKIEGKPLAYDIEISAGMLEHPHFILSFKPFGKRFAIVADDSVAYLYGKHLLDAMIAQDLESYLFSFSAGEMYKTRRTKEEIEDQMLEKRLGRDTCLIAMGGGVTTDLGGYVAATYCRGIPLVLIPTSLLGMVDASIGGKTGVNVPMGKNLIGSIYQPLKIFIDPTVLKTLAQREIKNGVVEMIKHGLIGDPIYFDSLEQHAEEILALDFSIIETAIYESCKIKQGIVDKDVNEAGERRLVNFGHTIGHALECLSGYTMSHGEAVAVGILVESYMAVLRGHLENGTFARIRDIFEKYSIPIVIPEKISLEDLLETMILDKKSIKGIPRFVMLENIGAPIPFAGDFCTPIEDKILVKSIEWMNDALCAH